MKRKISLIIGLIILIIFLAMMITPQLFTSYGLKEMFEIWSKPSLTHLLGTNDLGYDIATELIYGARNTLLTGLLAGFGSLLLGIIMGILSTLKNALGVIIQGIINIFVMLPKMVVLIVLAAFLPHTSLVLGLLITGLSWVGVAREVKAKVLLLRHEPFMESMMMLGYNKAHIVIYHLLPNLKDVIVTRALLGISSAIMMESSLSFLGLGDTYHPTWGTMMSLAYKRGAFFRGMYSYLLAPGICISLVALSFYLISLYFEQKGDDVHTLGRKEVK